MSAQSSVMPPHPNKPHRDDRLIHAGKGYGIMYSIWGRFQDIINYGSRLVETNPLLLSARDRAYREEYLNLTFIEPKVKDLVADCPLAEVVAQLKKGRNEFRNSQVHTICQKISTWGIGVPDEKHLRGFGDDVCGRLLCPSTQDWGDPTTRQQIRSFQISVTADDFPRFLWEGEQVDQHDMKKGFLRGELLVMALRSMLIGPAAARPNSQSTGVRGNADILNVQQMTIPSLAFAATVVHYALSAESNCQWSYKSNSPGFNNLVFYQRIISTVKSWNEEEQQSLLGWWDRMVLSRSRGGVHAMSLNDTPTPGSAAAIMLQQAASTGEVSQ